MTGHHSFKELTAGLPAKRQARITERVTVLKSEMALAEVRQALARSQKDIAQILKVNQPAVAKLEKRADMYVSNLRRYIEALGGSLEITATFPDGRVNITNFSDLGTANADVDPQI